MNRFIIKVMARLQETSSPSEEGAVAAEYGVLLAGIVAVVAIAAAALGGRIGRLFDAIIP